MKWLRSWGWVVLLVACGAAAGLRWSSVRQSSRQQGPPLVTEGPARMLVKEAMPGSTVSRVFRVKNRSVRPVQVSSISKGCNCLDANLSVNPIPPGQTAEVTLSLQVPTRGREAGSSVVLNTRETDQPPLRLQLHALTTAVLAVKPESLLWPVGEGGERERRVAIVRLDERPLTGVTVNSAPPGVAARLEQVAENSVDVVLALQGQAASGTLIVETKTPGRERIEVPVAFEHKGLRVMPGTMVIPEAVGRGAVELYSGGAAAEIVATLKCPPHIKVESSAGAGGVRVVGMLKERPSKERQSDELVLRVEAGGKLQDLVVPVVVYR